MLKRLSFAISSGLVLLIIVGFEIPIYAEICQKNEYTGAKECAAYHIPTVFFWHVGEILNYYGGTLTAVATVAIADEGSTPFKAGKPIYGRFEIVNVGDAEAYVRIWRGLLIAGQEGSPPAWPSKVDTDSESEQFEANLPSPLRPGVYAELRMKSRYPLSATLEMDLTSLTRGVRLYAIGRISYEDGSGTTRTTEFCRCWRMPSDTQVPRFYRVDDPDFEYED